jgi:pantoate--beta-alanine ligase
MKIFNTASELTDYILSIKKSNQKVGFVPTMGALHQGHLSLIEAARKDCDKVVCSIFVNPTQFNNPEDLEKYPRTEEQDIQMLKEAGCDVVFLPSVAEIYPQGVAYEAPALGAILHVLEGHFRPGHFEGMMQVVEILLRIVRPDKLYMGLKDYQQYLIVCKMVAYLGLPVEVKGMATVREADGLAMSSRNVRLSAEGRKKALKIYEALRAVKEMPGDKNFAEMEASGRKIIEQAEGAEIEYFSIADADTLLPPDTTTKKMIILAAVWIDGVRLIDNLV